jgi:hypothetical protein
MKCIPIGVTLFLLLAIPGMADQLDIGGVKYNGTFVDYREDAFHFITGSGKKRSESPSRVKMLILEKPAEVTLKVLHDREERRGLLKGYEFSEFTISIGGKDAKLHFNNVLEVKPQKTTPPPPAPANITPEPDPPPPVERPEKKEPLDEPRPPKLLGIPREAGDGNRYPISKVNTAELLRGDTSASQRKAIASFTKAKASYDAFMNESSSLVGTLGGTTGKQRAALLAKLRDRKNKEQPLKDALLKAHRKLESEL